MKTLPATHSNPVVALDIGYGYTKAVWGSQHVVYPSLVGPAVQVKYNTDLGRSNGHGLTLAFNGKARFLGEYAALQSPFTVSPRTRDRDPELLQMLALGACYQLGLTEQRLEMVTGLPVRWYADQEQLAATLTGSYEFSANGEPHRLEIAAVKVVPQPFGSLFRVLLNPLGIFVDEDRLAQARVAILDIGTHTTDYAYADRLRYVEPRSGSIPVAMARVYELVQRALAEAYDLELELPDVEAAIQDGHVTRFGEQVDIRPVYRQAFEAVSGEILAEATTLWGDGQELMAVLLTGGGAAAFVESVRGVFPHVRQVPHPQLANAIGFYRYGLRKFRRQ
jgi:plasmid segregation protein ParM